MEYDSLYLLFFPWSIYIIPLVGKSNEYNIEIEYFFVLFICMNFINTPILYHINAHLHKTSFKISSCGIS